MEKKREFIFWQGADVEHPIIVEKVVIDGNEVEFSEPFTLIDGDKLFIGIDIPEKPSLFENPQSVPNGILTKIEP